MQIFMWHIQISILCAVGTKLLLKITPERIERFISKEEKDAGNQEDRPTGQKRKGIYQIFFCPVINIIVFVGMIYLVLCSDERADEINREIEIRRLFRK